MTRANRNTTPNPNALAQLSALAAIFALAASTLALQACSAGASPPRFTIESARIAEVTDEGVVVVFDLEGQNPNPFALPLREVRYTVSIDGQRVFQGERIARATLPRLATQRVTLPAAFTREQADRAGLISTATNDTTTNATNARLRGSLVYELPGSIAEIFFDAGLRRPRAPFSAEATLTP